MLHLFDHEHFRRFMARHKFEAKLNRHSLHDRVTLRAAIPGCYRQRNVKISRQACPINYRLVEVTLQILDQTGDRLILRTDLS